MRISFAKGVSSLAISSILAVGCQTSDSSEEGSADNEANSSSEESTEEKEQPSENNTQEEEEHGHDHDHEHDHSHAEDEEAQQIYEGYFEDSQVEDRSLSEWEGDWQSVYPYLQDGTLDEVFAYKAEQDEEMTEEEYKEYYEEGYETEVDRIVMRGRDGNIF